METELADLSPNQVEFLKHFEKNATNISQTCRKVGIDRSTYHRWFNTNDTFKTKVSDEKRL